MTQIQISGRESMGEGWLSLIYLSGATVKALFPQ